jgi:hypothetical protein
MIHERKPYRGDERLHGHEPRSEDHISCDGEQQLLERRVGALDMPHGNLHGHDPRDLGENVNDGGNGGASHD